MEYILKERISVLFLQEANFNDWDSYLPIGYKYKLRESSMIIYSTNYSD